jgi:hypothetical protein
VPSCEKRTEKTDPECPVSVRRRTASATRQSWTLFPRAAARIVPSGEKASDQAVWTSVTVLPKVRTSDPSETFQSLTLTSPLPKLTSPPEATYWPSGE